MISLRYVTREFWLKGRSAVVAVRDVSLEVSAGEFVAIVGRSGSGKTTLLNLTAGLLRPTSGEVLIEDVTLDALGDSELARLRREKFGFVFQFPSLLPSLTVLENVVVPASLGMGRAGRDASWRAADLLGELGLTARFQAYPHQLSAGEQKRAVIARALINQPRILLADEPTGDLDQQTEKEVMSLLREINARGTTVLMVTHSLDTLPGADRAYRMEAGSLEEY